MLTGRFSISRPRGAAECDYIEVEIVDESSGVRFLQVQVKYADFALALTSLEVGCKYELHGAEDVGKVRETRYEEVFIPDSIFFGDRESLAQVAVEALESGWVGNVQDALNHHKEIRREEGGRVQRVLYTRLV